MTNANAPTGAASAIVRSPWFPLFFAVMPFPLIMFGPAGAGSQRIQRIDVTTGRVEDISPMHAMAPYAWAVVLVGLAFWLLWVYRARREVGPTATGGASAERTALLNLVPLFNLVWAFKWPAALLRDRHGQGTSVRATSTSVLTAIGLLFFTLSVVPPGAVLLAALGLASATVGAGLLQRKLDRGVA